VGGFLTSDRYPRTSILLKLFFALLLFALLLNAVFLVGGNGRYDLPVGGLS